MRVSSSPIIAVGVVIAAALGQCSLLERAAKYGLRETSACAQSGWENLQELSFRLASRQPIAPEAVPELDRVRKQIREDASRFVDLERYVVARLPAEGPDTITPFTALDESLGAWQVHDECITLSWDVLRAYNTVTLYTVPKRP